MAASVAGMQLQLHLDGLRQAGGDDSHLPLPLAQPLEQRLVGGGGGRGERGGGALRGAHARGGHRPGCLPDSSGRRQAAIQVAVGIQPGSCGAGIEVRVGGHRGGSTSALTYNYGHGY